MEVMTVRRTLSILVMIPLVMTACNSITGTQDATPPVVNVPIKNCIDDLRAVNILQPAQDSEILAGTRVQIAWEVLEFCSGSESRVAFSLDGGKTWAQSEWTPDSYVSTCAIGEGWAGRTLTVKVTVRDGLGEVSDRHTYVIVPGDRGPRVPQQRN